MQREYSEAVLTLLRLTRHAEPSGPVCRDCLHDQIREELASLSWGQDIEQQMSSVARKMGAPC